MIAYPRTFNTCGTVGRPHSGCYVDANDPCGICRSSLGGPTTSSPPLDSIWGRFSRAVKVIFQRTLSMLCHIWANRVRGLKYDCNDDKSPERTKQIFLASWKWAAAVFEMCRETRVSWPTNDWGETFFCCSTLGHNTICNMSQHMRSCLLGSRVQYFNFSTNTNLLFNSGRQFKQYRVPHCNNLS